MNRLTRIVGLNKNLLRTLKYENVILCTRHNSTLSTQESTIEVHEDKFDDLRQFEPRVERRKPPVEPLMKNIMVGQIQGEMLAFQEFLNKDELTELNERVKSVEKLSFDDAKSDDEVVDHLKRIRMFGAPVLVFNGGYAANMTERCRYLETLGSRMSVAKRLKNHWNGIDFMKNGLDPEDVNKIISPLITGDSNIRVLYSERIATDPSMSDIRCAAEANFKGEWLVSGEKILRDEDDSDMFYVALCKNERDTPDFFLVFPSADGVAMKDGLITFRNTPGILIGRKFGETLKPTDPNHLFDLCMANTRLETATLSLALLRSTIKEFVQHTRNKFVAGKPYRELPLLEDALSEAVTTHYAIESMIYYTAGLMDAYEKPDAIIESTLCKTYASSNAFNSINGLISALSLYELPPKLERYAREARTLYMSEEHNDRLNIYAALCGLQFAGTKIAESVKKARDPFSFPSFVLKKLITDRHQQVDDPPLKLYLHEHLHLSLQDGAKQLEYCIMRVKYAVEILLTRHGIKIVEEHRSLKRLSAAMSELYSAFTALSRASRAYCIGLHMSENEIFVAAFLTARARDRVKQLVLDIDNDFMITADNVRVDISEKAFSKGGAYHEHPLERVFF